MKNYFIKQLLPLALSDPRIMLVTGDLGYGVFDEFREKCPDQFLNAGIAEQNMTGLATGMALEGRIVFTYSIGNFSTLRCLEQIRNDACYHNANVNIVSVGGGFSYGALGISHHATEDLAIMRSLPDLAVVCPGGTWEATEATKALVNHQGTCFLRLDNTSGEDAPHDSAERFVLGKARKLKKGTDVSIIVSGGILEDVQKACNALEKTGISVQIISMHTVKPLDKELIIQLVKETPVIVTVEEHTVHGGLGSAVAETLMDNAAYPEKFLRIALEAGFSSIVGSQQYLRRQYGLDAESITDRIKTMMNK